MPVIRPNSWRAAPSEPVSNGTLGRRLSLICRAATGADDFSFSASSRNYPVSGQWHISTPGRPRRKLVERVIIASHRSSSSMSLTQSRGLASVPCLSLSFCTRSQGKVSCATRRGLVVRQAATFMCGKAMPGGPSAPAQASCQSTDERRPQAASVWKTALSSRCLGPPLSAKPAPERLEKVSAKAKEIAK